MIQIKLPKKLKKKVPKHLLNFNHKVNSPKKTNFYHNKYKNNKINNNNKLSKLHIKHINNNSKIKIISYLLTKNEN